MSELPVFYEARLVGRIHIRTEGASFAYSPEWLQTRGAFPISVLMPLTHRPIEPQIFLNWASNLLPEASQLKAVSLKIGASADDVIAILSEIGRDTAGALSVGQPGSPLSGGWREIPDENALERIIDELPNKPFLVGEDGVSMSLAGAQSKLGVSFNSAGKLCIPVDGAPSTYILKPDIKDRLYGSVQNEALCMTLASLCGLNAPAVTTGRAGKRQYFLIKRYDRLEQSGRWRRLHQEDYCQALGRIPAAKYENNQTGVRGPRLSDMFAITRNVMQVRDVMQLLDYVIFNVVTCNTDAHSKNYSMMISGRGVTLAPIYDVLCAAVWEGVTENLAQRIGDQNRGQHIKRRHWERMATECGIRPAGVVSRVREIAELVKRELPAAGAAVEAMPAGPHSMLPHFQAAIAGRANTILQGLNEPSVSMVQTVATAKKAAGSTKAKKKKVGAKTAKTTTT